VLGGGWIERASSRAEQPEMAGAAAETIACVAR
jgi:hypothetical protein